MGNLDGANKFAVLSQSREEDFKSLYFKIQKLINSKVQISLKYEQLKTPEVHSTLVKPLSTEIIQAASLTSFNSQQSTTNINAIYILFLLRYEYQIQSKHNLIKFDLLLTKSVICEIISVRMLREFAFNERVQLLFVDTILGMNTLELAILSSSKVFLSHPAVIQIVDKFYAGELNWGVGEACEEYGSLDYVDSYDFDPISLKSIEKRLLYVPRYVFMLDNIKFAIIEIFYLVVTFQQKTFERDNDDNKQGFKFERFSALEFVFWVIAVHFCFSKLFKLVQVSWFFTSQVVWNFLDIILIVLFSSSSFLRLFIFCFPWNTKLSPVLEEYKEFIIVLYINIFSLISTILFPRMLAMFNNYEFFNLIIISFKQMFSNLIALCCLFLSLISGFYLSFISLTTKNLSKTDISFDMLKIFFGFTPVVWNNWENYNSLGKFILLVYLFAVQFLLITLLIVILSDSYITLSKTSKHEFNYLKSLNLLIHFKLLKKKTSKNHNYRFITLLTTIKSRFETVIRSPITISIFLYERIKYHQVSPIYNVSRANMSSFTFFKENTKDQNLWLTPKRSRIEDQDSVVNTLRHLKTASTDSLLIDAILHKKYGSTPSTTSQTNVPASSNAANAALVSNLNCYSNVIRDRRKTGNPYGLLGHDAVEETYDDFGDVVSVLSDY